MEAIFHDKKSGQDSPEVQIIVGAALRFLILGALLIALGGCFAVLYLRRHKAQLAVDRRFTFDRLVLPIALFGLFSGLVILCEGEIVHFGFTKSILLMLVVLSTLSLGTWVTVVFAEVTRQRKIIKMPVLACVGLVSTMLSAFLIWNLLSFVTSSKLYSGISGFFLIHLFVFGWICSLRHLFPALLVPTDGRILSEIANVKLDFTPMVHAFSDPKRTPIGISMTTGNVVYLDQKRRFEHSLFSGATGTGKSTIMRLMLAHAILHSYPAIVIDQKGDGQLQEVLRGFAKDHGIDPDRILKFSLADLSNSVKYNPLKEGTANEIKDRIMGAFDWSDQYYESLAARVLAMIIPSFLALKVTPTLKGIRDVMMNPKVRDALFNELEELATQKDDSPEQAEFAASCCDGLEALSGIQTKDLQGLLAQLDILANVESGKLLSPSENESQLDFAELIEKKQIVIFELPAASGDQSRRIGRMILGHLKSFMALIETRRKPKPEFLPILIDEFGAYANEAFIDFLKQARSAGMAIHCFFQSRGDLTAVSESFMTQIVDNTIDKGILRQDAPESAEYWAQTVGTQDAIERSYQVGGPLGLSMRTGAGNERLTKQMIVEHDVFKKLNTFQMILVQKNPYRVDAVQVWRLPFEKRPILKGTTSPLR